MLREAQIHNDDAGDVYLRVPSDLKSIHLHIAALPYPILDRAGLLQNRVIRQQTDRAEHKTDTITSAEILPPEFLEGK